MMYIRRTIVLTSIIKELGISATFVYVMPDDLTITYMIDCR